MIYLDNSATTKLSPNVIARMHELMKLRLANPSSQHADGRRARQVVENARESILKATGARTMGMACDQLIFTSGGTEANNLAVLGLADKKIGAIVVSAIEHPSVLAAADQAEKKGRIVIQLPADPNGVVRIEALKDQLERHRNGETVALVSVMIANNETGVLQPVQEIARICAEAGVLLHTDAVQALGKQRLRFEELNVDAMTITAHKLHGPVGIGALILKKGIELAPQSYGGFQQLGLRPGTEMAVLAGGFEAAVLEATDHVDEKSLVMRQLRDQLQNELQGSIENSIVVGANAERLPHTLSIAFPGVERQALQLALDMAGIACSTGSACASGSSQPSHVLKAMNLPAAVIQGGIRLSVSGESSEDEILNAVASIRQAIKILRNRTNRLTST